MFDSILKNTAANAIRSALSFVLTLAGSTLVARHLGPDGMGLFSYALWMAALVSTFANLGLPLAVQKHVAERSSRPDEAAIVARRILLAQIGFASAITLASGALVWLLHSPDRRLLLLATALVLPQALSTCLAGVVSGMQRYDRLAWAALQAAGARLLLLAGAVALDAGIRGLLLAAAAAAVLETALMFRSAVSVLPIGATSQAAAPDFGRISRFACTLSVVVILDAVVWQSSEMFFLRRYSSLVELAFYGIAYTLAAKASQIGNMFSTTLLPAFSLAHGRSGTTEIAVAYQRSVTGLQAVMVPLCLAGALVSAPVVTFIYGPAYAPAAPVLTLLLLALSLTCIGPVSAAVLYAVGRESVDAKIGALFAALNIGLALWLVPRHGAMGAAAANCAAQVLTVVVSAACVARLLDRKFPLFRMAAVYAAALLALLPLAYAVHQHAPWPVWLLSGVAAAAIYAAVCQRLKLFDIAQLLRRIRVLIRKRNPDSTPMAFDGGDKLHGEVVK
jgi:O-antigen/teichoic acid export membrane protein